MKFATLIAVSALLALSACAQRQAATGAVKPVATVGGVSLSRELFEYYARKSSGKAAADLTAAQREQLLDALIRSEIAAQQAQKDGLDKAGDTAAIVALNRLQLLQTALSESYLKSREPTEAELRSEYDTQIAALPKHQFKAHHILVGSKEAAQKLVEQLHKGSRFEDLARKESTDASKANGGDLGDWFIAGNMVKPFGDAIMAMKKGEITASPVQSQYGWHVIRLDDLRELPVPSFDQVKDQVKNILQGKKFTAYLDELQKTVKVEKSL